MIFPIRSWLLHLLGGGLGSEQHALDVDVHHLVDFVAFDFAKGPTD